MSIFSKKDRYNEDHYEKLLDLEQDMLREKKSSDSAYKLWLDAYEAITQYEEEYPRETNAYYTAGL